MTATENVNCFYSEQSWDWVRENLNYLTNKNRGNSTSEANLFRQWRAGKLGQLVKRLDPTAYNQFKQEVTQ